MRFYWLIIGILGAWRVTHLLHAEDGPWGIFVRIRRLAGRGTWATLFDCFYCLSLWMSAPFACALGESWKERLLLWPALSAGSIILEKLTMARAERTPPAIYHELAEDFDGMLRSEETISAGHAGK